MSDPTTAEAGVMPGDAQTTSEIVARTSQHVVDVMPLMSDAEIHRTWRVAQALAASRMFKNVHQAEQAFAKILIGRDLGLSATQSMQGIHVFDGNIQIAGPTLGSFIKRRRDEGYDYKPVERTHECARIQFITPGFIHDPDASDDVNQIVKYTIEDAEKAKLTGKPNWKTDPRSMLFWRAMSNGVKAFCPEIMGGIPIYVEGEIEELRPAQVASAEPAGLPHGLEVLLERAWAIDRRAFPRNEIVARLDGTEQTFEAVCAEVGQWITERESQRSADTPATDGEEIADAEVVPDAAEAPAVAEPEVDEFTRLLALEDRWANDAEWRAAVEPLLSQRVDFEFADGSDAADRLVEVTAELEKLGVPAEWMPQALGSEEG